MKFLDILQRSGHDLTDVKKLIETENKKLITILSEVFSGKYVSKEEAILNLTELMSSGKSKVGSVYIGDNYNKIVEKIQELNEASIKIIINNNEDGEKESFMDENRNRKGNFKKGELSGPVLTNIKLNKNAGAPEPMDEEVELDAKEELEECNLKKKNAKLKTESSESEEITIPTDKSEDDLEDNAEENTEENDNADSSKLKWLDIIDKIKQLDDDVRDLMSDQEESEDEESEDEESEDEESEDEVKIESNQEEDDKEEITEVDNKDDSEDGEEENGSTDTSNSEEEISNVEQDSNDDLEYSNDTDEAEGDTTTDEYDKEHGAESNDDTTEDSGDIEKDANELQLYLDDKYNKVQTEEAEGSEEFESNVWEIEDGITVKRNPDNSYTILNGDNEVSTDEPKESIRKILQQEF